MKPLVACVALVGSVVALSAGPASLDDPREVHLRNLRQLTFGGENAEAYFDAKGERLILQAHTEDGACDQIFVMDVRSGAKKQVSTGGGRTTCSYFYPNGKRILYSSTRAKGPACPPPPDMSRGYVWGLYDYDIWTAKPNGKDARPLTSSPGYDAEATISRDGRSIVFTSVRDGDLDIYAMDADGKNVKRLTTEAGYDGGPFFSADGTKIVYRASHPTDPAKLEDYRDLLKQGLIRPGNLEIWVMNADGSDKRQITANGAANFAPYFHPDGKRIIFASNKNEPRSRNFDLYMVNVDGSGLEQITFSEEFDSFPMFTPDGKKLVWSSNRNQAKKGDTNVFLADWVESR